MSTEPEIVDGASAKRKKSKRGEEQEGKSGAKKRKRDHNDSEGQRTPPPSKIRPSKKRRQQEEEATNPTPLLSPSASVSREETQPSPSASRLARMPSGKSSRHHEVSSSYAGSPFCVQTTSFYLPLSPIAQISPLEGLCAEHFSPLLLTYYPPLEGVILSHHNARFGISQHQAVDEDGGLAKAIDEYAAPYIWVTADFVVLRPKPNLWIEGVINVQSEAHIGVVCWNLFNASISRDHLPDDWNWVDNLSRKTTSDRKKKKTDKVADGEGGGADTRHVVSEGQWVDGSGNEWSVGQSITFRVRDFDALPALGSHRGFVSIEGSLLSRKEERRKLRSAASAFRSLSEDDAANSR